jgi:hypothetical protein
MGYQRENPFESIENAQEYLRLLAEELARVLNDVEADRESASVSPAGRQLDALRLVFYKLQRLQQHIQASGRILNDLRRLRRLFACDAAGATASIQRVRRSDKEREPLGV